jgi:carbamoyltransferase
VYILGLSTMSHDPAATLIGNQGVIAAIEEGKLTRTRVADGIPRAAIQFCLEREGISIKDLDGVAIAGPASVSAAGQRSITEVLNELGTGTNILPFAQKSVKAAARSIRNFDHHLCHASSAFFASGMDHALIVTLDERGDGRSGLVSVGRGTHIREIESIAVPNSLAWFYSIITGLIGFRPHSDEHKTQWLSLAGEPTFAEFFLDVLRRVPSGPPQLNRKYFQRRYGNELSFSDEFYRLLGIPDESRSHIEDSVRANIAASLHKVCAVILCDWLEALRCRTKLRSLCLAGGLFLNPLLVAAIETNTKFQTVFVQPAAGNEGTAIGAAWLAWNRKSDQPRIPATGSPYWGPEYSNEAIKGVLDNCKASYRWCDSENDKINETALLLQAGKIVAWYQGAAEFGPRALGNRSLLASPWSAYVKENLNEYVKHRESFRPFALAMPEEDCAGYFEYTANSHFLTTMATAKEKGRKLLENLPPGFLLKGNLVRLHVVSSTENPLLWKLLKRSGENAPAPLLVNTSFNLFGEPLVIRPRDAVRSYFCSGVDALVAGSFLLKKK